MSQTDGARRLGFFTRVLDDVDAGERYRLAAEQIIHAEAQGFDSAWVAQHHFHGDEGGLPSPAVFLAHVGARTSKIRLGTGVITLSMENAIRVAEDTAVLDLLTGGRLEVGFGTGGTRESFAAFGVDSERRGEVYAANLRQLRQAWGGEDLGGGNRVYPAAPHLRNRAWLATFSAFGARLAGETGDGLMLSRTQPRSAGHPDASLPEIQNPLIDAYLGALPPGRAPRILASRTLFVTEDRKRARQFAETGLNRFADKLAAQGQTVGARNLDDLIRAFDSHIGTPDEVIASLRQDTALARSTDIVFQVHSIDPPHEDILRSIELTAAHVAPALGWHKPSASCLAAAE